MASNFQSIRRAPYLGFIHASDERAAVNPLGMTVHVDPGTNGGANIHCIYSGVFLVNLRGAPRQWRRGYLRHSMVTPGRVWVHPSLDAEEKRAVARRTGLEPTVFTSGSVMLSPVAMDTRHPNSSSAGWAIDEFNLLVEEHRFPSITFGLHIEANVAVRGFSILYRVGYLVNVLGTDSTFVAPEPPPVEG